MTDSIATPARVDRAGVAIYSPRSNSPATPIVPVGLQVAGKSVLVVGAGRVAARKAAALVDQGALVTVVAPNHGPEMGQLAIAERRYRSFEPSDLDGAWFAATATGVPTVDGAVFAEAEARHIWCNSADDPKHCSAILPAVARRGAITIAISSGGTSPAAASWIKRRIQQLLDDETVAVAEIASRVRDAVKGAGIPTEVPGWAAVLDNEAIDLIRSGTPEQLERRLFEAVAGKPDDTGSATIALDGAV